MDSEQGSSISKKRKKYDKTILRVFYILVTIFMISILFSGAMYLKRDIFVFLNMVFSGLVTVFFLTGMFSFFFYGDTGLISTKQLFKVLSYISLGLTVITLMIGFVFFRPFLLPILREYLPGFGTIFMPLLFFIIFFTSYMAAFFILTLQSFGLVSVMAIFQRKYFSDMINDVKKITEVTQGGTEGGYIKKNYFEFLRWIFDIPKVLDTSKTELNKKTNLKSFPWRKFRKALGFESIVALVLAIYISLNPFLLEERSFNELFAFTSTVSYFIPVLVLPLFIFLKLDVKIPGPATDFHLFDGIKSRLMSIVLTLGTLLVFVRFGLETVDLSLLVSSFIFYFAGFFVNTLFITFVYFNYFEHLLADDIVLD